MGLGLLLSFGLLVPVFGASTRGDDFGLARDRLAAALSVGELDGILSAMEGLKPFDNAETAHLLVRNCLQHDELLVHREATKMLSDLQSVEGRAAVVEESAEAKRWELRAQCIHVMASYGGEFMESKIREAAEDKKWQVRSAALRGLHHFRNLQVVDYLIGRLKIEGGRLIADSMYALRELTGQEFEAPEDWLGWWAVHKDTFELPTAAEVRERLRGKVDDKTQDVKTIVGDGLYGPIYSEKIAFILDRSGSMSVRAEEEDAVSETRLKIAVRELQRVLEDGLTKDTYFNIVVFADEVQTFFKGLERANDGRIKKAIKNLEKLRSGGETNAYGALEAAFADPEVDTIYLLSDGAPTVGAQSIPTLIRMQVQEWNRDRRVIINCIGFFPGTAKNQDKEEAREFLRTLAHENEGFYKEIY